MIGIKNKVKAFYFGDLIRTWIVIAKEKEGLHLVFLSACGFNSFFKSGCSCEKLAHPCPYQLTPTNNSLVVLMLVMNISAQCSLQTDRVRNLRNRKLQSFWANFTDFEPEINMKQKGSG